MIINSKHVGGGGADPVINPLSVTENGTYTAPAGVDGYSPVTVNVAGGGGITLLGSGTYTLTGATAATELNIPISISGTPRYVLVVVDSLIPDIQQMYSWAAVYTTISEFAQDGHFNPIYTTRGALASGSITAAASRGGCVIKNNNTLIVCSRDSSSYPVCDNTYNWYVWGDSE